MGPDRSCQHTRIEISDSHEEGEVRCEVPAMVGHDIVAREEPDVAHASAGVAPSGCAP